MWKLSILLALITLSAAVTSASAAQPTSPSRGSLEIESNNNNATSAPAASAASPRASGGYIDQWYSEMKGCVLVAGPVYFTPGECFYLPFLSSFTPYVTLPKADGYAIVYYSDDNPSAYLYPFLDEACQQSANWSYWSPLATENCQGNQPNIWPTSGSLGPPPPEWPGTQLMAPTEGWYQGQTCIPEGANGLALGQCFGAGTPNPSSVFCNGPRGSEVTFVAYSPGSNCEPEHVIQTRTFPTGCNISEQTMGYVCPDVSGPPAPPIPGSTISLTWYDTDNSCSGPEISSIAYQQETCVGNVMYNCNVSNGTYTQYEFSGAGCQTLQSSQTYSLGCDPGITTIAICQDSSASLDSQTKEDASKSKAPLSIAEY